ncbi:TorD/DmsD family molecular chaperone [Ferrimonas senticii]|uniref:TorD/DmsD family molecular chaperone n=1 Tax=Ferrimonas senticii TaxID=394566 RepID=UPI00041F726E|nr:molecular chaperone TorD family protein [Ferrimonas senticii]
MLESHFDPQQAQVTSAVTGIFHHVFYEPPTEAFFNQLRPLLACWPQLSNASELMSQQISESLEHDNWHAIYEDYHRLFVGPGTRLAYPWGSVYTDKENLLFGASTISLERFFKQHGIAFQTAGNEPLDHIGLLLAALSGLFGNANQTSINTATVLLNEHILPWAYRFTELVTLHAQTIYYRNLAKLLTITLHDLQCSLALTPSEVTLYK